MHKIFSALQIRALDQFTITQEQITSLQLMERACKAFVEWFVIHIPADQRVAVVCGAGNNGGDGLGIARLLHEWNYPVEVWLVDGSMKETEDFKANRNRLPAKIDVKTFISEGVTFQNADIVIDAIVGTGLSRPVEGIYKQAIVAINASSKKVISVDVPSGLFTDVHSTGEIVRADFTLTFQLPKLAFLQPENSDFVGEWHVLDIGLSKKFIEDEVSSHYFLTKKDARKILRPRQRFSHKGKYGHACIIAGSIGKVGAAVLATRAALRAGAGLVTVHTPSIGYTVLQTAVPEAMVTIDIESNQITSIPTEAANKTIGIGPGIGQHAQTISAFEVLLKQVHSPMVIDADALNILANRTDLLSHLPANSILTPHPKELERLVGRWNNDFEKLKLLKAFSKQTSCYIVAKGAYSAIVTPLEEIYFNSTGNPGMATGGCGDVLTGILTGLLAQGYDSFQTCVLGVYLHGLSGDMAVREGDMNSLIASDLIEQLPLAFKALSR